MDHDTLIEIPIQSKVDKEDGLLRASWFIKTTNLKPAVSILIFDWSTHGDIVDWSMNEDTIKNEILN